MKSGKLFIWLSGLTLSALILLAQENVRDAGWLARLNTGGGGGAYVAYATTFDGDWLERDADLTGNADGLVGSISFWYKPNDGDGIKQIIYESQTADIDLYKQSDNTIILYLTGTDSDLKIAMKQDPAVVYPLTNGFGWVWVAMSWDNSSAANPLHLYINGTNALHAAQVHDYDDVNIDYTEADHGISATIGGASIGTNCLMEVWINLTNYVDWSVSGNRDKFFNAGSPVDLGADGTTPGFGQPIIYLRDQYAAWTNNFGYGGDMNLKGGGSLSDCTTP